MKVFFDEDVPRKLVRLLPQHNIHTVVSMNWGGIKNGALLTLIEREGFDAFLTGDQNMENQQRLDDRPLRSAFSVSRDQLARGPAACPGTVEMIDCGVLKPRSKL